MLMDPSITSIIITVILVVSLLLGLRMLLKYKGPLEADADFKNGRIRIKKD